MTAPADEQVLHAARQDRLVKALDTPAPPPPKTARQLLLDDLLLERYAPAPRPLSTTRPQARPGKKGGTRVQ